MKLTLLRTVSAILLLFAATVALAQEKDLRYYNTHEKEILPDARAAFSAGQYERAMQICQWYFIIVGDSEANAMREKASRCAVLAPEMKALMDDGDVDAAKEKADAILALNPDDPAAKEVRDLIPSTGVHNGHEWVNLGLPSGLKWATCCIGASSPEALGDFFAWGETETKSNYNWDTLKYCENKIVSYYQGVPVQRQRFTKYNKEQTDMMLEPSDDAAHVNWGGKWRMPTVAEFKELIEYCEFECMEDGWKVVSRINGNSIFLSSANGGGIGCYSNMFLSADGRQDAFSALGFMGSSGPYITGRQRYIGVQVRPVFK